MRLEHLLSGDDGKAIEAVPDSDRRSPLRGISVATFGGLAQLARAPALQAGGQRFESVILHTKKRSLEAIASGVLQRTLT